jgi:hypothetical protein
MRKALFWDLIGGEDVSEFSTPHFETDGVTIYWSLISSASSMTTPVLPFGYIRSREPFIWTI